MKSVERYYGLLEARDESAWLLQVRQIASGIGYDRFLLAIANTQTGRYEDAFIRSTYPQAWRDNYTQRQMVHFDPTVAHCHNNMAPLVWSPSVFASRPQKEMYEEARHFGLVSGLTLPIHGPRGGLGMFCVVRDAPSETQAPGHALRDAAELALFRDFIFDSSRRFMTGAKVAGAKPVEVRITRREREVVTWLAAGKSSWELSIILNCSEAAVNFHVKNLRIKFGVSTRREVIVRAISLGLINL